MLDISFYDTRPGYYPVLFLCCGMVGYAFSPLALFLAGPICVNEMIYYVGLYDKIKI
jgi:hypothetical protein